MKMPVTNKSIRRRIIASIVLLTFLLTSRIAPIRYAYGQELFQLPQPGTRVSLSPTFAPPILKGVKVYADNPFRLDFILDEVNSNVSTDQLKLESTRLIKYFLASITVPERDLWVNLSPYEKDRIVPDAFGVTEMGRDLLAQDYMLKQITASVIYPDGEVGKAFWAKVYAEAQKRYGTADVPVDTFNKVWIVPEKAVVYTSKDSAYITESKLKVMLAEDYIALEKNAVTKDQRALVTNRLGSDIVREIVIPILEKEVNEGKNFAQLRQVYHSLILAIWYKDKVKESIFGEAYVDQNKTRGVDIENKAEKKKIWAQYVEAFKKGAYNYIKEDIDPATQHPVPKKHFSGGMGFEKIRKTTLFQSAEMAQLPSRVLNHSMLTQIRLTSIDKAQDILDGERYKYYRKYAEQGWEFPYDSKSLEEGLRKSHILTDTEESMRSLVAIPEEKDARLLNQFAERLRQTSAFQNGKVVLNKDSGIWGLHMTALNSRIMRNLGFSAESKILSVLSQHSSWSSTMYGAYINPHNGRVGVAVYDQGNAMLDFRAKASGEAQDIPVVHLAIASVLSPLNDTERKEWVATVKKFEFSRFGEMVTKEFTLLEHTNDVMRNAKVIRDFASSGTVNDQSIKSASIRSALSQWAIGDILDVHPLKEDRWLVRTGSGKYILKNISATLNRKKKSFWPLKNWSDEHLAFVVSVQNYLARDLHIVPSFIAKKGHQKAQWNDFYVKADGSYYLLEEFRLGRIESIKHPSENVLFEVGNALAALHERTEGFSPIGQPVEPQWTEFIFNSRNIANLLNDITAVAPDKLPSIKEAIAAFQRNLSKKDYHSLPAIIIHGDVNILNFLFDDIGHVSGMIDFINAYHAPRVLDLMDILYKAPIQEGGSPFYSHHNAEQLIKGYQAIAKNKLSKKEIKLLPYILFLQPLSFLLKMSYQTESQLEFNKTRLPREVDYIKMVLEDIRNGVYDQLAELYGDNAESSNPGGIDLVYDKMNIQIQSSEDGIKFRFDPAMIQQLQNASGLTPVSIDISPMSTSIPMFLGIKERALDLSQTRLKGLFPLE